MRGEARVVLYLDMSRVLLEFVCEGEFWGLSTHAVKVKFSAATKS